jgi:hypothetical protein
MRQPRLLALPLVAVSLVLTLAALLRMEDPVSGEQISGVIRLPPAMIWAIMTLFAAAAVVMALDIARRMRSRSQNEDDDVLGARAAPPKQPWLQALAQFAALVNVVVLAYLLWTNTAFRELMALGHGAGGAGGVSADAAPDAPFLFTWVFGALALAAGVTALAFAVWLTSGDRLAAWWQRRGESAAEAPPPALVQAVDDSREDLRTEGDARRAIIRCYARFERAAAEVGIQRRPWQTPMEFMREVLSHLPGPAGAVRALTALFELARFSARPLGTPERDQALEALDRIGSALDEAALQRAARDGERRVALEH